MVEDDKEGTACILGYDERCEKSIVMREASSRMKGGSASAILSILRGRYIAWDVTFLSGS